MVKIRILFLRRGLMFRVLNGYLLLSESYEDRSNAHPVRLLVSLIPPIHQGTVMLVFQKHI